MSKDVAKRGRGRPTVYDQAKADVICERIAKGESLRRICLDIDVGESTVRSWHVENIEGFAAQYELARNKGLDAMADELLDIADDARNDYMASADPENPGYRLNGEHIQRSRLRVDTRKWYLSKLAPKRYGEKLAVDAQVESRQENIDVVQLARMILFGLRLAVEEQDKQKQIGGE